MGRGKFIPTWRTFFKNDNFRVENFKTVAEVENFIKKAQKHLDGSQSQSLTSAVLNKFKNEIKELIKLKDEEFNQVIKSIRSILIQICKSKERVYTEYLYEYDEAIEFDTSITDSDSIERNVISLLEHSSSKLSVNTFKFFIKNKEFKTSNLNKSHKITIGKTIANVPIKYQDFIEFITMYFNQQSNIQFSDEWIGNLFKLIYNQKIYILKNEETIKKVNDYDSDQEDEETQFKRLFENGGITIPPVSELLETVRKLMEKSNSKVYQNKSYFVETLYDVLSKSKLSYSHLEEADIKYMINFIKFHIHPLEYKVFNKLLVKIKSKEFVDFIIENKEFYQLVPSIITFTKKHKNENLFEPSRKINEDEDEDEDEDYEDENIKSYESDDEKEEIKGNSITVNLNVKQQLLNFTSFEIANYFHNKLKLLQDGKEINIDSISTKEIYYLLFLQSIKNCDIETLVKIEEELRNGIGCIDNRFQVLFHIKYNDTIDQGICKINYQEKKKKNSIKKDSIRESIFFKDEIARDKLLIYLNLNEYKLFTPSTFGYLCEILLEIGTEKSKNQFNQIFSRESSGSISAFKLSFEIFIHSVYTFNFDNINTIMDASLDSSKELVLEMIKNGNEIIPFKKNHYEFISSKSYKYEINLNLSSNFNYTDIKSLLIKLLKEEWLPVIENKTDFIYRRLYRLLLQSKGITIEDVKEINEVYEKNNIEFSSNNFESILFYWFHIKDNRLSKILLMLDGHKNNIKSFISYSLNSFSDDIKSNYYYFRNLFDKTKIKTTTSNNITLTIPETPTFNQIYNCNGFNECYSLLRQYFPHKLYNYYAPAHSNNIPAFYIEYSNEITYLLEMGEYDFFIEILKSKCSTLSQKSQFITNQVKPLNTSPLAPIPFINSNNNNNNNNTYQSSLFNQLTLFYQHQFSFQNSNSNNTTVTPLYIIQPPNIYQSIILFQLITLDQLIELIRLTTTANENELPSIYMWYGKSESKCKDWILHQATLYSRLDIIKLLLEEDNNYSKLQSTLNLISSRSFISIIIDIQDIQIIQYYLNYKNGYLLDSFKLFCCDENSSNSWGGFEKLFKHGFEKFDLLLNYIPTIKFSEYFIDKCINLQKVQIIQYYLEIGLISDQDIPTFQKNALKKHYDYKHLQWVKNLSTKRKTIEQSSTLTTTTTTTYKKPTFTTTSNIITRSRSSATTNNNH